MHGDFIAREPRLNGPESKIHQLQEGSSGGLLMLSLMQHCCIALPG